MALPEAFPCKPSGTTKTLCKHFVSPSSGAVGLSVTFQALRAGAQGSTLHGYRSSDIQL